MRVKTIILEDFVNFRLPSMVIGTPFCDFKCEKECGECECHNSPLLPHQLFPLTMKELFNHI